MDEGELLVGRFEEHRPRLRAIAQRMLGSASEADDAVQEAWLRLHRQDAGEVANLAGWLTTVVARICLDMLRSRRSRREEPLDAFLPEPDADSAGGGDPEHEALLAESVGPALLVVLERLTPAERVAFVLHDTFGVPFGEIAPVVGRSPAAVRQLASRARRQVRAPALAPAAGSDAPAEIARQPETRPEGTVGQRGTVRRRATIRRPEAAGQREVVAAFLAAARAGDFAALLALLDPEVTVRADASAVPAGAPNVVHGARAVAGQALSFSGRARSAQLVLVDGAVGVAVATRGRLSMVLDFAFGLEKIVEIDVVADPARLARLDVRLLDELDELDELNELNELNELG